MVGHGAGAPGDAPWRQASDGHWYRADRRAAGPDRGAHPPTGPRRPLPLRTLAAVIVGVVVIGAVVGLVVLAGYGSGGPSGPRLFITGGAGAPPAVPSADQAAQTDLTNTVISGKELFTDAGLFPRAATMVVELHGYEPQLTYSVGPATGDSGIVSVDVDPSRQVAIYADQSLDGRCWYAEDDEVSPNGPAGGFPMAHVSTRPGLSYAGSPAGVRQIDCPTGAGQLPPYLTAGIWTDVFPP